MKRTLIVPAAGLGTRLQSVLPKVLTPVAGLPMIAHVLRRCATHCDRGVIVLHPSALGAVEAFLAHTQMMITVATQRDPTGMLDAILLAGDAVRAHECDRVWICWCDQVLLSPETIDRMAAREQEPPIPDLVFPTAWLRGPYTHFDRDAAGRLVAVRQRREADELPEQGESDAGVFSLSAQAYADRLPEYAAHAGVGRMTRERNFLPFLPWLAGQATVATVAVKDPIEARGINTPADLAFVEEYLKVSDDGGE